MENGPFEGPWLGDLDGCAGWKGGEPGNPWGSPLLVGWLRDFSCLEKNIGEVISF